jgi:hypothetical protein
MGLDSHQGLERSAASTIQPRGRTWRGRRGVPGGLPFLVFHPQFIQNFIFNGQSTFLQKTIKRLITQTIEGELLASAIGPPHASISFH